MGQFVDLTGVRYGRLLVVARAGSDGAKKAMFLCLCDCGTLRTVRGNNLRSGVSQSCGCLKRELTAARTVRHGHGGAGIKRTREYHAWAHLWQRCTNPKNKDWRYYGARGIWVDPRWESFENFLADMPPHPGRGYSIDRVDNERGYGPGNCRWATAIEQRRNQRRWIERHAQPGGGSSLSPARS